MKDNGEPYTRETLLQKNSYWGNKVNSVYLVYMVSDTGKQIRVYLISGTEETRRTWLFFVHTNKYDSSLLIRRL